MVDHKSLLGCHQRFFFQYCQGPYIDIDRDLLRLWGKTVALVGWFHAIGGQSTSIQVSPWDSHSILLLKVDLDHVHLYWNPASSQHAMSAGMQTQQIMAKPDF